MNCIFASPVSALRFVDASADGDADADADADADVDADADAVLTLSTFPGTVVLQCPCCVYDYGSLGSCQIVHCRREAATEWNALPDSDFVPCWEWWGSAGPLHCV